MKHINKENVAIIMKNNKNSFLSNSYSLFLENSPVSVIFSQLKFIINNVGKRP